MNKDDQGGYSAISTLVVIGIIGSVVLMVNQSVLLLEKSSRQISSYTELINVKHYIRENFSCQETTEQSNCGTDSSDVDTFGFNGNMLTSGLGSSFDKYLIKSECMNDEHHFLFKDTAEEDGEWKPLFNSVPFFCQEAACDAIDTVSFEELPDGSPIVEGMAITDQFAASHGVSFSRLNNDPVYIAQRGGENRTFDCRTCDPRGYNQVHDEPDQPIGQFFLTDRNGIRGRSTDLVINYSDPVEEASAVLIDVDRDEEYLIEAFNEDGDLISSQVYGAPGRFTLDGRTLQWKIEGLPPGELISSIVIQGTKAGNLGFAFDNFSPSKVCNAVSI